MSTPVKELYVLKIKPYAENEFHKKIIEFDEEEWELIVDVFERLIRNFKQTFPEVEFGSIEQHNRELIINFREDSNVSEVELDYHIETLCFLMTKNILLEVIWS